MLIAKILLITEMYWQQHVKLGERPFRCTAVDCDSLFPTKCRLNV